MRAIKAFDTYAPSAPNPNTDVGKLHSLFKEGLDRDEAEKEFCKGGKSPAHFRSAFHELTEWLVKGVLSNSFTSATPAQQMVYRSYRWGAAARTLIFGDNKEDGMRIAKNALKVAERYDLSTALALARALHLIHTSSKPLSPSALKPYAAKVDKLQKELNAEIDIERIYNNVNYCILKETEFGLWEMQLNEYKSGKSWKYNYYLYLSKIKINQLKNEHESIISNCQEAIICFNKYKMPLPYITRFVFYLHMIPILILKGEYGKVELELNNCLALPVKGGFNWHMALYLKAINGFYSGKVRIAHQAWHMASKNLRSANADIKERWRIVKAYLHIYEQLGQLNMPTSFRLGTFLNNVPESNKDKSGLNMAIKTAHLLHLIIRIKKAGNARNKLRLEKNTWQKWKHCQPIYSAI